MPPLLPAPKGIFLPLVLAATLAACDDGASPVDSPTTTAPSGPFAVGTIAFDLVDPGRPEPHTEAPDDHRRFGVRVWYPAAAPSPRRASYFLDPIEQAGNAQLLGLPANAFDGMDTHATVGAPAATGARLPVLVFSPGRNVPVPLYSLELEDLASRGYAVFALSHPHGAYGTGVVAFADGTVAIPFGHVFPDETRDQVVATWSADQRFLVDAQASIPAALAARLDWQKLGVFGHSIGGAAASESCLRDARFRVCGNLDGSVGTAVEAGPGITRPFLLMRAQSTVESTLDGFFASLRGPAYQLTVGGAGHDSFSDVASVIEHLQAANLALDTSDLALGNLGSLRRYQLVSLHLAAFFDRHLRGKPSPLLSGSPSYPEIQIVRRGD